jgi:hypothetical protein
VVADVGAALVLAHAHPTRAGSSLLREMAALESRFARYAIDPLP